MHKMRQIPTTTNMLQTKNTKSNTSKIHTPRQIRKIPKVSQKKCGKSQLVKK